MINKNELNSLNTLSEIQVSLIFGGSVFLRFDENKTIARKNTSGDFDMDIISVCSKHRTEIIANRAITEKRTLTEQVPRFLFMERG